MKVRNIAIGVVVGGITIAGGVLAVAWQKGWSIRETVELGAGVIASKTSRHTIADRTTAILAKKPKLKGIAASAGGKLRILVFKNERSVEVHAPGWNSRRSSGIRTSVMKSILRWVRSSRNAHDELHLQIQDA